MIASDIPLTQHRIVIFGAGTAGIGIATQIYEALMRAGLNEAAARERIWLIDRTGLLLQNMNLHPSQVPFARKPEDVTQWILRDNNFIGLYDVVYNVKPTILIGCSTVKDAFNEEIVKLMAAHTNRPIIMPLSNPTLLSEARPDNLLSWTDGKAIIATGSPFLDITFNDKNYRIAQSNNAFAFPGIGLGAISAKAKHISDDMLWAATKALSQCSPVNQDKDAPLLPRFTEIKKVSMAIALAVAEQARKEGLAQVGENANLNELIKANMWEPKYYPLVRKE